MFRSCRQTLTRWLGRPGSSARPRAKARLGVEALGDRVLPAVDWAAVAAEFSAGQQVLARRADEITKAGFGADLPVLAETVGSAGRFDKVLAEAAAVKLTPGGATAASVADQLRQAGFTVTTAADDPDAAGNVLAATKTVRKKVAATFTPGEVDGFEYWDKTVAGRLGGSVKASAQAVEARITVGVDLVGGQLRYWAAPGSSVAFTGLKGKGTVSGTVDIGVLRGVKVSGEVDIRLDADLNLKDPNRDGKVRADELRAARPAAGRVDGSITFTPKFAAKVSGLVPMSFGGKFAATLDDNKARTSDSLARPDYQAFGRDVALTFLARRPTIDLFSGVQKQLDTKVPFTNKTVGDFLRTDKIKTLLAAINPGITKTTPYQQVLDKLRNVGITFALTNEAGPGVMDKLVRGQAVTLIEQRAKADARLYKTEHEFPLGTVNLAIVSASLSAYVEASLKLTFDVTVGLDTRDVYVGSSSGLGLAGSLEAGFHGKLRVAGYPLLKASGGLSLDPTLTLRLKDPTPGDGKVYLSEVSGRPVSSLFAADFTLDLKGKIKAKLNLVIKDVTIASHEWKLARLIDYHTSPK